MWSVIRLENSHTLPGSKPAGVAHLLMASSVTMQGSLIDAPIQMGVDSGIYFETVEDTVKRLLNTSISFQLGIALADKVDSSISTLEDLRKLVINLQTALLRKEEYPTARKQVTTEVKAAVTRKPRAPAKPRQPRKPKEPKQPVAKKEKQEKQDGEGGADAGQGDSGRGAAAEVAATS